MDKGDYSVGRWTKTHGNDAGIQINPEFNLDAELGRWFRTKEFREALSLSIDRDQINQLVYLGIGTPQGVGTASCDTVLSRRPVARISGLSATLRRPTKSWTTLG